MLESEIKEQIMTRAKNIKFMIAMIDEIDALPDIESDKRADEYVFYQYNLKNTDCLDEVITKKRLLHEMAIETALFPEVNLYMELVDAAVWELIDSNYVYLLDDAYKCREDITTKKILQYLIDNFFKKQEKFGGYITRCDFKKWVIEVLKKLNYGFSLKSVVSEIDQLM